MSGSDKEKKPIVHRAKFLLLLETIYQTASCCECLMKFTKLIKSDICIVFCCLAKISLNSDRVCYSLMILRKSLLFTKNLNGNCT